MTRPAPWTQMPGAVTRAKKQRKPIRKVSKRMQSRLAEYHRVRSKFLKDKLCEVCLLENFHDDDGIRPFRCTARATEVHHKRGRGRFLCDQSTFMAVCSWHHHWIHDHPSEAMKRGWILIRLKKD